jgi:hypothetical protein
MSNKKCRKVKESGQEEATYLRTRSDWADAGGMEGAFGDRRGEVAARLASSVEHFVPTIAPLSSVPFKGVVHIGFMFIIFSIWRPAGEREEKFTVPPVAHGMLEHPSKSLHVVGICFSIIASRRVALSSTKRE